MATKTVELPEIGAITLVKRKGVKHIRLSVSAEGQVRVSMPPWVPFVTGLAFAKQKTDWLKTQIKPLLVLKQGAGIGKGHHLEFVRSASGKLTTRITPKVIRVHVPIGTTVANPDVQQAAVKACIRALKQEAEDVLPGHLRQLAEEHGFQFRSVEVKRLKSRWGSCTHRQEIVLNCFLMQLPWELIDYVLLHELTHTKIMAHGSKFWSLLGEHVTDLPAKRQAIRKHRPTVSEALNMSSMA